MTTPIYLDYAAATPLDGRVREIMEPYLTAQFYNPSSSYLAAKAVRQALEQARAGVAHWLGAKPAEVMFTAGATESVNLAIHGVMRAYPGAHFLTTPIEHEAVLAAARHYNYTTAPVMADGTLDPRRFRQAITENTVLISVGYANNELGTVQPLKQLAAIVQEVRRLRQLHNNPLPLYLHTDASQGACYLDLHTSRLGIDLLTLNGGKMYGPKQTGALFVKSGIRLEPLIDGGGQEGGLRSGTQNVAGCIGFATALDIAQGQRKEAGYKQQLLRDELEHELVAMTPAPQPNGSRKRRLPHILHLSWPGVDAERLLMLLDERGIMASTGSACAANKQTASHVLVALGLAPEFIQGSLRLSLGRPVTQRMVRTAAKVIAKAVQDITRA